MIIGDADYITHSGVMGMKWGVRKNTLSGVSHKTNRQAAKDAEEFTRAKLFYGEGAGTRRKLIKNTVEARAKRDPAYKKAFDHHVANTDLGKRSSQAQSERKRKNAINSTKKTTRGIKNVVNGNSQFASTTAVVIAGGALAAHKKGYDKLVFDKGKQALKNVQLNNSTKVGKQYLRDLGFM